MPTIKSIRIQNLLAKVYFKSLVSNVLLNEECSTLNYEDPKRTFLCISKNLSLHNGFAKQDTLADPVRLKSFETRVLPTTACYLERHKICYILTYCLPCNAI